MNPIQEAIYTIGLNGVSKCCEEHSNVARLIHDR